MLVRTLSRGDTRLLARTRRDLEATFAAMLRFSYSAPSLPLVILISGSESNSRQGLTSETVAEEAKGAPFTRPIPGFLVNSPVPLHRPDRWFGRLPARLPRTLIIHGTIDPNTAYGGALAHAEMLKRAGDVTLVTVENGAHLLPLAALDCFIASVSRIYSCMRFDKTVSFRGDPRPVLRAGWASVSCLAGSVTRKGSRPGSRAPAQERLANEVLARR